MEGYFILIAIMIHPGWLLFANETDEFSFIVFCPYLPRLTYASIRLICK